MFFQKKEEFETHMNNYSRFYRLYTQHLRKYYEISQQDLAKSIGIPNSSLSKIEAGKQEMDEKTFKKVIFFFEKIDKDFRFSFDPNLVEEVESWIQKSVHAFVMMIYESISYTLKEIIEDSKYIHSFAYFHIQLLKALYDNLVDIDCMNEIKELLNIGYFQDNYHLAVLYDLYGVSVYSMDKNVLNSQIEALYTALGYCHTKDTENLRGLILYHLIMNNKIARNFITSLEYFEECENCLQKAGAYRRLMHANLNKANIYAKLQLYPLAEKIYKVLLESTQSQINETIIIIKVYNSYSWYLLVQKKYQESLIKAKKAEEAGSRFPDLYITFAYANYKLDDFVACKQAIARFRKLFSHNARVDFIDQFFVLLEKRIDQELLPDSLIKHLLKRLSDFHDVELETVLYPFLIEYYQSIKNYKNASAIQSHWINYLQFTTI